MGIFRGRERESLGHRHGVMIEGKILLCVTTVPFTMFIRPHLEGGRRIGAFNRTKSHDMERRQESFSCFFLDFFF